MFAIEVSLNWFRCAGSWADMKVSGQWAEYMFSFHGVIRRGTPVTAWGITRQICKKSVTVAFSMVQKVDSWLNSTLSTLWNRSIAPFEAGWYTDVLMFLSFRNAGEVNWGLLSLLWSGCQVYWRQVRNTVTCFFHRRSKGYLWTFTVIVSERQSVSTVPSQFHPVKSITVNWVNFDLIDFNALLQTFWFMITMIPHNLGSFGNILLVKTFWGSFFFLYLTLCNNTESENY